MNIRELKSENEILSAFSVIKELRSDLSESEFMEYVALMRHERYRLFGLLEDTQIVSVAGLAILTNLYYKRHIWVYDLVTVARERSKGYGARLLEFIEDLARKEECKLVVLSSGLERVDAHRFYTNKMRYSKSSYVFKKMI